MRASSQMAEREESRCEASKGEKGCALVSDAQPFSPFHLFTFSLFYLSLRVREGASIAERDLELGVFRVEIVLQTV